MRSFRKIFEAYGGDYDMTMSRLMDDQTLYLELLDMLLADDSLSQLETVIQRGDLTAGFQLAHTLKGIVGNLGLDPLYAACAALVEPLRAQDSDAPYPLILDELRSAFRRVETLRADLHSL